MVYCHAAVCLPIFQECLAFRASAPRATSTQFRPCQVEFVQEPACLIGVEATGSNSLNHLVQAELDGIEVIRRRQVQVPDAEDPPASPSAQAVPL